MWNLRSTLQIFSSSRKEIGSLRTSPWICPNYLAVFFFREINIKTYVLESIKYRAIFLFTWRVEFPTCKGKQAHDRSILNHLLNILICSTRSTKYYLIKRFCSCLRERDNSNLIVCSTIFLFFQSMRSI